MSDHATVEVLEPPIEDHDEALGSQALPKVTTEVVDDLGKEPAEFYLGTLGDGRLRVIRAIHVAVSEEAGQLVAQATEFDEFGFGDTRSEAVRDLQLALSELFFTLSRDEKRLGRELSDTLGRYEMRFAKLYEHHGSRVRSSCRRAPVPNETV